MKNGKPSKKGSAIIKKPISPLENLRSVIIQYIVSCGDCPDGLETEMVVKITF
jgi:hypothetical protein